MGFLAPVDRVGDVTISIGDPGVVTGLGKAMRVDVTVKNAGREKVEGKLRLGVVDDWRVVEKEEGFSVEAAGIEVVSFHVIPGVKSYAALYPVHAFAEFDGKRAHAVLITTVAEEAVAKARPEDARWPVLELKKDGRVRLDEGKIYRPSIALQGENAKAKPVGWMGTDESTGAVVALMDEDRGERRHALTVHPAYRTGWGDVYLDYRVKLPVQKVIGLDFATAIRDNAATEPPSDGVEFRAQVDDGAGFKTLFTRFSKAKRWEEAHVDLSAYAGQTVTLRLVTDPGPAHNTVCDQSFWAEPAVRGGEVLKAETDAERTARREKAIEMAKAALHGREAKWSWKLKSDAGITGAAVVPGPCGMADAYIAFAEEGRVVVFDGFTMEVDEAAELTQRAKSWSEEGRGMIACPDGTQVTVWAEKGALRIGFRMPGVKRDARGEPRYTALGIGPASEKARRVYAGFGNVLEEPGRFDLNGGGFMLATRHVGMDFANGLSLVEACDIFPDRFHVNPEKRSYSLITHHDATFSFIPSGHGAFAAARVYHDLVQFKPAGGVAKLQGKMCLDQWGGDYKVAAENIEKAARDGLTDAVFVKHCWQRWGYDYRLPDIYPPADNFADFRAMVEACKRHGILFCPHDNYIDFYPDAEGYSYDHMIYNEDGTPQRAWYNEGREAQSYRWAPTAFRPWLERNLKLVTKGFGPTAYFVDVFGSIPPIDFYDRQGRFYPKTVAAKCWGAAFDRIREALGNDAPTISEAGQDGLIGHLDAGESDHDGWQAKPTGEKGPFCWNVAAADGERIPWHDMASHGSFVLLAGGLGPRYAGGQDEMLHGYGSDDYLCTTVMGGRNPMCEGPFSRRAVMTYWLLHDVCKELAHDEMLSDEFAGDDIHRQISRFSGGGEVMINRGKSDWEQDGGVLPKYGFVAKAGKYEADVTRRDGVISASAKGPGSLFVDARPANVSEGEGDAIGKVTGVDDLGQRRFRVRIEWEVLHPVREEYHSFVHLVRNGKTKNQGIILVGGVDLDPAKLRETGTYSSTGVMTMPDNTPGPLDIRFGLYQPKEGGDRLPMLVAMDSEGRARGGTIRMDGTAVRWTPEPADADVAERIERLNMREKVVDFGAVATNGAFRLKYGGEKWELMALPGSAAFKVQLRLDQLNAGGKKVRAITGTDGKDAEFRQTGDLVEFETNGGVEGYGISMGKVPCCPEVKE